MWQYRKVYARWCVPSPRAPTTAPDAPPLHLYSTSDPADSVPTSPMTPPNPHFRIQSSFYLPPPNPPAVAIPVAAQPAVAVPTAAKPAITVYTSLTIAAFEASAADASSATSSASPPDLIPSDADTDHSVPMTPSSSPIVYLHLSTRSYRRHTPALIS